MTKLVRLLPVLAGGLLLSACATPWQVARVQDAQTLTASAGTPFTQALTEEYKAAAANEVAVENEWRHAVVYADKATRAAGGEVFGPEEPAAWDVSTPEVLDARARLLGYFQQGSRERVPAASAKAQVNLDCWIEEEWEGDSDTTCKNAFLAVEPLLKAQPAMAAASPKIIKTFVVYFNFNKADITTEAKRVLTEVAAAQADLKPNNIYLSGYTDTVGGSAYNQVLSEKRATTVETALNHLGVTSTRFDVKAYGKDKLAVITKDGVKEAKNRRVEIYFEK